MAKNYQTEHFKAQRAIARIPVSFGGPNAPPLCNGKSRRTGKPCRQPAVNGSKFCRYHGGYRKRMAPTTPKRLANRLAKATRARWKLEGKPKGYEQTAVYRALAGRVDLGKYIPPVGLAFEAMLGGDRRAWDMWLERLATMGAI